VGDRKDGHEVVSILNDLIEICDDGAAGFRTAAEEIRQPEARTMFIERARRIDQSKVELADLVRRLGGAPVEHGHATAGLHRGWMNLKAAVTGKDDEAILVEVERGEEIAVTHYRDALNADLPADVRMVVQAQARGAEMNLTRVQTLRRSQPPATGGVRATGDLRP
jgi:uncharacterized protein (TIGR02284 family)